VLSDIDMDAARAHLRRDPVMAALMNRAPDLTWPPPSRGEPFAALVRAVIGQQVSVKAAASIEARVRTVTPNLAPHELAAIRGDDLRACGLSWAKVRTVHALAERAATGQLDFQSLRNAPDESVVEALVPVPGIGRWTAEMFLMFALHRADVFAWGDAGLRKALRVLYGEAAGAEVTQAWSPFRSLACRYLWWSLHNEPAQAAVSGLEARGEA